MRQKPQWLTIKPPTTSSFDSIKSLVWDTGLHTVCQSAHCPNMTECWSGGTATFMVMGDTCTRGCRFCAVKKGRPGPLVQDEPRKLAETIAKIGMFEYVVLTSVDRDDLPDQGSNHLAECISEIKGANPGPVVEALIPDFQGRKDLLLNVIAAEPDVIAHNVETVPRLQVMARDRRANYGQSLGVLKNVKMIDGKLFTKTSLMLGLGEKEDEVLGVMADLKEIKVDIITFGQYLRPSTRHIPVAEYITPEKFKYYEGRARNMGFLYCASGPFVRSSYKAAELFLRGKNEKSSREI